ncbi:MAG: hypothetical protein ACPG8W_06590 [Candidatus Promineifilaceae bacterium]
MTDRTDSLGLFSADCTECEHLIQFNRQPTPLQLLQCPHCEDILIVISNMPIKLSGALEYAIEFYE